MSDFISRQPTTTRQIWDHIILSFNTYAYPQALVGPVNLEDLLKFIWAIIKTVISSFFLCTSLVIFGAFIKMIHSLYVNDDNHPWTSTVQIIGTEMKTTKWPYLYLTLYLNSIMSYILPAIALLKTNVFDGFQELCYYLAHKTSQPTCYGYSPVTVFPFKIC